MTKEQALKIIDRLIAQYSGIREEHIALQQAMDILSRLVEPPEENK